MKKAVVIILIVVAGVLFLNKPFKRPQTKVEITQQIGLPSSVVETLRDLFKP